MAFCVIMPKNQKFLYETFRKLKYGSMNGIFSRRSNALRCPKGRGLNVDGALETPVDSGAEGASVKYVKLSGKRTKNAI